MSRPIREASNNAIEQARIDAEMFYDRLHRIGRVLEDLLDEEIPWLRALSFLAPTDAADRSSLIRNMLILRVLAGDASFGRVEALVEQEYARFVAISEIRDGLPQHQSILRADIAQRLEELPPADAAKAREDISKFLEDHPATDKALTGEHPPPLTDSNAT